MREQQEPNDAGGPPHPTDASAKLALGTLAVLLVVVIAWALPREIQPGDAGELATVMLKGGVPHPPGYPWMRILGPLARLGLVLGLPAAAAAALPCALVGAAGWTWLAASIARLCSLRIAIGTVLFVATAHVVVLHTIDAEVWGPLVLAIAAIVHLAVRRDRAPWLVGLVFGAALAVHLTVVWLLPLVVLAAWPRAPRHREARAIAIAGAKGVAGTLLGLSIFATLAIGDTDAPWRWGELDSAAGLVRHVLRSDYGTFSLSLHDASPAAAAQLGRAASSWAAAWSAGLLVHPLWALPIVALVVVGARATWPTAQRSLAIAVAATWLLSAIAFPLLHDIDPASPFGAWILERFDIMPLALSTIPLALAMTAVAGALRPRLRTFAMVGAAAALGQQIVTTATRGTPSDDDAIEVYARDVLRTPDPARRSIVIGTDDHRTFPVIFAHAVLGEGPQVLYVDASLLAHPWYRAALRRRMPELPDVDKPVRLVMALWATPAGRDVAVYLANDFSLPSTTLPRVPEGVLWRVLADDDLGVGPDVVLARHHAALQRLAGPPQRAPSSPFAADLAAAWHEPSVQLAAALRRAGRPDLAASLPTPPD
jgi:hypothetical protein